MLRQHYDTDALDASTLLAALFGFLPATDERLRNTVDAIDQELTENGFVLRYRTDETDDGLSGKEGTFLICSFWLVSALAVVGEMERANNLMERLLRITSPLGLYAEEFEVERGPAPRELPAGVLAPGADPGGGTDHPGRLPGGAVAVTGQPDGAPRVVVLGGGLAGVACAHRLGDEGVSVTLVDRHDYQQFQPLLYQVATSQLPAEDIARPHRTIFREHPTVEVRTAEVTGVDLETRSLSLADGDVVSGSHLVIAAGGRAEFFGVPGAAEHAFPLYSVADAERLRLHFRELFVSAGKDEQAPERRARRRRRGRRSDRGRGGRGLRRADARPGGAG